MAKLYGEISSKSLLTLDKSFARANGQPLDASEVYYSLDAAKTYAAGAQAYVGQKIVVVENNIVTHYGIEDTAGNLKELGSKPVGDNSSIVVAENGTISLKGVGTLTFERDILDEDEQPTGEKEFVQYQPLMTKDGLVWVEPSKTTVEGLATLIDSLTKKVDSLEKDVDILETAVGTAAKPETSEGAGDAVEATGLFKAIADEIDRATIAEKALGERIDDIEIPVIGVSAEDKILALGADKLISATVTLAYDTENKSIKLTGKDGSDLGSVDATPFIKDGMLNDVEYNADTNTLTFTWNTDSGEKTDSVVLSDIIEPYIAGKGLELNGNEFSIKVAEGNESFLTVTTEGIKLAGVTDAIQTAKNEAISNAAGKYATKEYVGEFTTGEDNYKDLDTVVAYINKKAEETLAAAQGGSSETAASVALALQNYKNENDPKVKANTDNITTINEKLKDIENNAEVNIIETIKRNGVNLVPDENRAVDITVPTKFSEITDDSGFDARITTAQNQANKGVSDASAAQTTANEAKTAAENNATAIGTLNGTVSGHTTTIGDHTTRIGKLESFETEHKAQYETLSGIVSGHTATIAGKAEQTALDAAIADIAKNTNAITTINEITIPNINENIGKKADSDKVYTKEQINSITGTLEEGKTLVQMIAEAKTAATYDDTEVRGLISANTQNIEKIYKTGEGETPATGILVTEIAATKKYADDAVVVEKERAEGVESDHETRIATMENFWKAADDPEGTIDKLAEIVAYIENDKTGALDMAADIQANRTLIDSIYTPASKGEDGSDIPASGVLVNEINRVENKIDANTEAIAAINHETTGILAQAKEYTNAQIAALPVATAEVLGLIKIDDNTIKKNSDNQIYIAKVSTDVLEQGSETLILNGGTATE